LFITRSRGRSTFGYFCFVRRFAAGLSAPVLADLVVDLIDLIDLIETDRLIDTVEAA